LNAAVTQNQKLNNSDLHPMLIPKNLFVTETTIALWRAGNASSPRMDHLRLPPRDESQKSDIVPVSEFVNGDLVAFVLPYSGGISLWDGKHPGFKDAKWYEIPAKTVIPPGLCIVKEEVTNRYGLTHYTVKPVYKMPLTSFIDLLNLFGKLAQRRF
jgi:hypothetical protein